MGKNNWLQENIPIKDLSLWDENARFPDKYFSKPEKELISYFLLKKNFKILEFAKEIVNDFDLPQIEKIIVYRFEERNIVLEGNRRLVAYKLLSNPTLTNDPKIKAKFLELKSKIDIDDDFELECLITEEKEQGLRYIERKHLKKNNEVGWGDNEKAHHKTRRGKATQKEKFKVALTQIIKRLKIPEAMKEEILGPGYITTFWRIIESQFAWKEYGFKLDKKGKLNIKDKHFEEKLKVIILNTLNKKDFSGKKVDSRSLNTNREKEKYLKSISKNDFKKAKSEIKKYEEQEKVSSEIDSKKSIPKSLPKPKGLFYSINVPYRLRDSNLRLLYEELRDIEVDQFPNATHDLLRSFLECSLIVFFKKTGEYSSIQKHGKHNPTLGEMLGHIIKGKSKSITDASLIETIKHIKEDWGKPYSLQRLNMINHNEIWVSGPLDVKSSWAKLEPLFKLILNP